MQELIPITFFICIAYAIRTGCARAASWWPRTYRRSDPLAGLCWKKSRRQGALRWGISLVCLALALALEAIGARDLTFGRRCRVGPVPASASCWPGTSPGLPRAS